MAAVKTDEITKMESNSVANGDENSTCKESESQSSGSDNSSGEDDDDGSKTKKKKKREKKHKKRHRKKRKKHRKHKHSADSDSDEYFDDEDDEEVKEKQDEDEEEEEEEEKSNVSSTSEKKSKKDILLEKISEILDEEEIKIEISALHNGGDGEEERSLLNEDKKRSSSSKGSSSKDENRKCISSTKRKHSPPSRSSSKSKNAEKSRIKRCKSRDSRSRSRSRKKSRSRSKSRKRSRSRSRKSRSRSRQKSRSRSKSRKRSRSRSRKRSQSRRRSHSGHRRRTRSRSRRRSRSQSRRKSNRSRSRSQDRRRRRSGSKNRSRTRSRSKEKSSSDKKRSTSTDKGTSDASKLSQDKNGEEKTSSLWDVTTVPEAETSPAETTKSSSLISDTVFQKIAALRRSNIEIKYGNSNISTSSSAGSTGKAKDEKNNSINQPPKASPYGSWETVTKMKDTGKKITKKDLQSFTELCQKISAKEGLSYYVEDNAEESGDDNDKDQSDSSDVIHHPFAVKPAPVMLPQMTNYSRRFSAPMNPAQAIMAGSMNSITGNSVDIISGPLEKHFPVSSGTDHREKETVVGPEKDLPVYEETAGTEEPINVSSVIARRLGAQQRLNANSNDTAAAKVLKECDLKLKGWSDRNKKPGKFTGERGVRMDKKEIAGAIETWVRKDFFHRLQPVTGGIGMRMMQNMGWKQGTALGKNNEGYVAPIAFDVKVGRSGLSTHDEQPVKGGGCGYNNHLPKKRMAAVQNVAGKHPVSALAEICMGKRLGIPEYNIVFESGQSHSKNFLMKVTVNNVDYQPTVASPNKKHAKAQAAMTALKILGFAGK